MNKLEEEMQYYCKLLKRRRLELGLSYADVFRATGIRHGNLSYVENGGNPQLITILRLCDLYNLNLELNDN